MLPGAQGCSMGSMDAGCSLGLSMLSEAQGCRMLPGAQGCKMVPSTGPAPCWELSVLDPDRLFWCVPPADVIAGEAGGRQQVCMNTAQREEVCPNTAFGKIQLEKVARTNWIQVIECSSDPLSNTSETTKKKSPKFTYF